MSLIHATRSPRWAAVEDVSWGFALAVIIVLAGLWSMGRDERIHCKPRRVRQTQIIKRLKEVIKLSLRRL
jgi:hypothetical protein